MNRCISPECKSKNTTGIHAKYGKWEVITRVCLDCGWQWTERHRWSLKIWN